MEAWHRRFEAVAERNHFGVFSVIKELIKKPPPLRNSGGENSSIRKNPEGRETCDCYQMI